MIYSRRNSFYSKHALRDMFSFQLHECNVLALPNFKLTKILQKKIKDP